MRKQSLLALLAVLILTLTMMTCTAKAFFTAPIQNIPTQTVTRPNPFAQQQQQRQQQWKMLVIVGVVGLVIAAVGYDIQKKKQHEEIVRELQEIKNSNKDQNAT